MRDDRRLLNEGLMGLGPLDETCEIREARVSTGARLGASKNKTGDRSRQRDDVPAPAGPVFVCGSRRRAAWIGSNAMRASFFVRLTIGLRGHS